MPRASTGHGANYGENFGGGGLVRLSGLLPLPSGTIPLNDTFHLTAGVAGALVDISKVQLIVGGESAFSGGAFQGPFAALSSYQYNPSVNGYDFSVRRTGGYLAAGVTVTVYAETRDGASTTQTYQLTAQIAVVYPAVPLGVPLGEVPVRDFSGEAGGLLGGARGLAFFTPSLTVGHGGSQMDVKDFEVSSNATERYSQRSSRSNRRPWLWGPVRTYPPGPVPPFPPRYSAGYEPRWTRGFCFMNTTRRTALGVMVDTVTTDSTVILY